MFVAIFHVCNIEESASHHLKSLAFALLFTKIYGLRGFEAPLTVSRSRKNKKSGLKISILTAFKECGHVWNSFARYNSEKLLSNHLKPLIYALLITKMYRLLEFWVPLTIFYSRKNKRSGLKT